MPSRRRASSYQLLKLLEATGQIGVWSLNLHTGETGGSAGLAHITGVSQDESLEGLLDRLIHPDDRVTHGDLFDRLYGGRAIDLTIRIVRPDQTVRWVSVKAQIVLGPDLRPARAEGVAFDVTGPHEARRLAEQSTARYRGIVHAVAAVVWTTSPDGQVRPSKTWQALTGQSAPDMQGKGWLAAIHPEDRARTATAWRTAVEHATLYEMDHRVLCADGSFGWFNSHATPLHNPDGSVREWIGIMLRTTLRAGFQPTAMAPAALKMTGRLVRSARAMLDWSIGDLATAAAVSVSSVRRLEEDKETVQAQTSGAVRRALEAAGIEFIVTSDGRPGVVPGLGCKLL